jgi:hypothetical protein
MSLIEVLEIKGNKVSSFWWYGYLDSTIDIISHIVLCCLLRHSCIGQ